jgi:hypothetical protein
VKIEKEWTIKFGLTDHLVKSLLTFSYMSV